jgi:hypothetical protein
MNIMHPAGSGALTAAYRPNSIKLHALSSTTAILHEPKPLQSLAIFLRCNSRINGRGWVLEMCSRVVGWVHPLEKSATTIMNTSIYHLAS